MREVVFFGTKAILIFEKRSISALGVTRRIVKKQEYVAVLALHSSV